MKEPTWIDERDALALHDRLLVLEGGAAGLRDKGRSNAILATLKGGRYKGEGKPPNHPNLCQRRKGRGTRKIRGKPDVVQMAAA